MRGGTSAREGERQLKVGSITHKSTTKHCRVSNGRKCVLMHITRTVGERSYAATK